MFVVVIQSALTRPQRMDTVSRAMTQDDDRRDSLRVPIELKVEYKKLNTFFADYTKNICKGGTFIRTKKPLEIGTIFVFRLTVPTLKEPIAIRGARHGDSVHLRDAWRASWYGRCGRKDDDR